VKNNKRILGILAHPDDAEFLCAGTLALLHQKGWEIHIATVTPGDCGTAELSREQISKIRKAEAEKAVKMLDGYYHCLECDDVFILYDRPTLTKAIGLVREINPAIVFTHSPQDYAIDHENTSRIAQTACFACGIKNVETQNAEPFEPVPHLYYADPLENKDRFDNIIKPSTVVDITDVMDIKEQMLCCHDSQRSWLLAHHGTDKCVEFLKSCSSQRGRAVGCDYAEGFRQHLGHGFPQDNILKKELSTLAYVQKGDF